MKDVTQMTLAGHMRGLLRLGLPLIGGHLAQFAIGLTDAIMLGWYGVSELAALTLANGYFFTFFLVGSGFAWAVMPLVASFAAEDDQIMIRRATRMALWLSILFFLAALPLMLISDPVLRALGQSPDLAALAQSYLRIAGWGLLPALGVMTLKSYLAGLERTRVILAITVLAALANAALNYVLIFGHFGAPELGIAGIADVVEFHVDGSGETPYPVEYKRGRPKAHHADRVQLCAQGLCLEAMFGRAVPEGALFYGTTRRRLVVPLNEEMRDLTRETIRATRAMLATGRTPLATYDAKRCDACSLLDLCQPRLLARSGTIQSWLEQQIFDED